MDRFLASKSIRSSQIRERRSRDGLRTRKRSGSRISRSASRESRGESRGERQLSASRAVRGWSGASFVPLHPHGGSRVSTMKGGPLCLSRVEGNGNHETHSSDSELSDGRGRRKSRGENSRSIVSLIRKMSRGSRRYSGESANTRDAGSSSSDEEARRSLNRKKHRRTTKKPVVVNVYKVKESSSSSGDETRGRRKRRTSVKTETRLRSTEEARREGERDGDAESASGSMRGERRRRKRRTKGSVHRGMESDESNESDGARRAGKRERKSSPGDHDLHSLPRGIRRSSSSSGSSTGWKERLRSAIHKERERVMERRSSGGGQRRFSGNRRSEAEGGRGSGSEFRRRSKTKTRAGEHSWWGREAGRGSSSPGSDERRGRHRQVCKPPCDCDEGARPAPDGRCPTCGARLRRRGRGSRALAARPASSPPACGLDACDSIRRLAASKRRSSSFMRSLVDGVKSMVRPSLPDATLDILRLSRRPSHPRRHHSACAVTCCNSDTSSCSSCTADSSRSSSSITSTVSAFLERRRSELEEVEALKQALDEAEVEKEVLKEVLKDALIDAVEESEDEEARLKEAMDKAKTEAERKDLEDAMEEVEEAAEARENALKAAMEEVEAVGDAEEMALEEEIAEAERTRQEEGRASHRSVVHSVSACPRRKTSVVHVVRKSGSER